jgi:alpha-ketoglutarate-dependent taurine dioxygenase
MAYHMDHVFDREPVRILMLYGLEVPGTGGATKFRSTNDIYYRMDEALREKAKSIRCLHLFDFNSEGVKREAGMPAPWDEELVDGRSPFSLETASPDAPRAWQPLIWQNPRTGRPAVWCNPGTTIAFEGMSDSEGYQVLGRIQEQATGVPEYAHEWRKGDILMWNNLTLQHARTPFDPSEKRTLRRSALL